MLEEASVCLKRVFLNVDAGFDAKEVRTLYRAKKMEATATIAYNPCNSDDLSAVYQYFDE